MGVVLSLLLPFHSARREAADAMVTRLVIAATPATTATLCRSTIRYIVLR
jgi:hypothetical protein